MNDVAADVRGDLPGSVRPPTVEGLPDGYIYGVTRYADLILAHAFPEHFENLREALDELTLTRAELESGGGNKTTIAKRFDDALKARGWSKRNITIGKTIDGEQIAEVRGHEIDMFRAGPDPDDPYPGIACEMEWNNKDPFYDRDLLNFQALHREGALAVGIILTRGPRLQQRIRVAIPGGAQKYGATTTHWDKLVPRVNLGGGGECPLFLIGIEPERVAGL